jgi:hypothetical protein
MTDNTETPRMPNFWWSPTSGLWRGGDDRPCADAVKLGDVETAPPPVSSPEPEGQATAADTRQARIDEALARCDHYQASGSAIAKEITSSIRAALHAPCPSCGAWGGCPACIPQADAEAGR